MRQFLGETSCLMPGALVSCGQFLVDGSNLCYGEGCHIRQHAFYLLQDRPPLFHQILGMFEHCIDLTRASRGLRGIRKVRVGIYLLSCCEAIAVLD